MKKSQLDILSLLKIQPSSRSIDYVKNKKQFQLHSLLTEQRHPATWNLSFTIKDNAREGIEQILSVDDDISKKFNEIARDTSLLDQAAQAVVKAIMGGRKILIYGCGATGRLAKQMESALWRPFWRNVKSHRLWNKLKSCLPGDIEKRLTGEMTGGDRALISSLEGFEDLKLVGKLQLEDREVGKGDVVFCFTEGGETSSVIGLITAANIQYGKHPQKETQAKESKNHLYFIYNNPDNLLSPLSRSVSVLENPGITKINLTTGAQAITGSTRMQATTSETFIMGLILEEAIFKILRELLESEEIKQMGFRQSDTISDRLKSFDMLRNSIKDSREEISRFTVLESKTYNKNKLSTYFANRALITVFIDCAERSPTFHLLPLDTTEEKVRKCLIQVWTEANDYREAWQNFLGRDFRGLDEKLYKPHFEREIDDLYLKEAALKSLARSGQSQEKLFDFSFSKENIMARGPQEEELGVLVCMDEEIEELPDQSSSFHRFITLFKTNRAKLALILISDKEPPEVQNIVSQLPLDQEIDVVINLTLDKDSDPLSLRRQTALKILLNAHSTGVMSRIGRVVGNTMTNVSPSNLKLIGRATYLIKSHVNDTVQKKAWIKKHGRTKPISYEQANAVLFEAIDFLSKQDEQTSEVELSIIIILEALRQKDYVGWEEALSLDKNMGLENYLKKHNPVLKC
jgi:N-acetylmuramic acid 6-phosphate (MurNAc-6-P) etherase